MDQSKILVIGANGQLGRALSTLLPKAAGVDRDTFDMTDRQAVAAIDWTQFDTIINAAAYTAVDLAETDEGRIDSWASNATAVANLAEQAVKHDLTLVHISSDYVFDGTKTPHEETEPFSPLSVYGQSKAAGDIAARLAPKHYILRTSWVIGDGKNFIRTMAELANKGVKPSVVNDQIGRLTFTADLAEAIKHLLENRTDYGTYNLTNEGESVSWADIAATVYELMGYDRRDVTGATTDQYYAGKIGIAPRPLQSTLNLAKIKASGFEPRTWELVIADYVANLKETF